MKKVKQRVTCWCLIMGHSLAQSSVPLTLRPTLWHQCHVASVLSLDEWVCWASGRWKWKRYTGHQQAQNLIGKIDFWQTIPLPKSFMLYSVHYCYNGLAKNITWSYISTVNKNLQWLLIAFKENLPLCSLTSCLTVSLLISWGSHREPVALPKTWPAASSCQAFAYALLCLESPPFIIC